LAATVDKKIALTNANLLFAFNYFDTANKGFITKEDLKEVFRRQGKQVSDDNLDEIIRQAKDTVGHKEELKQDDQQSAIKEDTISISSPKPDDRSAALYLNIRQIKAEESITVDEFMMVMKSVV